MSKLWQLTAEKPILSNLITQCLHLCLSQWFTVHQLFDPLIKFLGGSSVIDHLRTFWTSSAATQTMLFTTQNDFLVGRNNHRSKFWSFCWKWHRIKADSIYTRVVNSPGNKFPGKEINFPGFPGTRSGLLAGSMDSSHQLWPGTCVAAAGVTCHFWRLQRGGLITDHGRRDVRVEDGSTGGFRSAKYFTCMERLQIFVEKKLQTVILIPHGYWVTFITSILFL